MGKQFSTNSIIAKVDLVTDELLETIKEFHSLPDSVKHKLKPRSYVKSHTNNFRGWFPFLDNDISHKEFFDMGAPWHEVTDH